uniref:Uncharacterized protein n=1 Tax=Acrobeloides nanus TaxID=290746 RepID=A0A914CGU8_9BILA
MQRKTNTNQANVESKAKKSGQKLQSGQKPAPIVEGGQPIQVGQTKTGDIAKESKKS